jgi:NAD(P)H dehydrogenase (quinone)
MKVKTAVIFYSATGNVWHLAREAAQAAQDAGADVRLRRVQELAPLSAIKRNERWAVTVEELSSVHEAGVEDLAWADVVLFGTPTRYGTMASQLKQFIDTTGPLWQEGALADKVYSAFTSTGTRHGGQESTLLALSHVFHHWGGIVVAPGYTAPVQFELGNPYGTSHVDSEGPVADVHLRAIELQPSGDLVEEAHVSVSLLPGSRPQYPPRVRFTRD